MLGDMMDEAGLQSEQVEEHLQLFVYKVESHPKLYKNNVSLTAIIVILLSIFPFERENIKRRVPADLL
mgnify:CR=1 FL=1